MKPLLSRPGAQRTNNWLTLQETMLQRLKEENRVPAPADLRRRARISAPGLVTEVLRPLRSQVSANVPAIADAARNSRRHHHRLYLVLPRRRQEGAGDNFLITGWHLTDACEIWQALKRTGQGHRIDVLPVPPAALAPEIFPSATGCWSPAANSPLPARGRSNSGSSRSSPSR